MRVTSPSTRAVLGLLAILGAGVADCQEQPTSSAALPSPGTVEVLGVAEDRFNPTHGTVFFQVSDAFFPADPRDVAVIVNDRQLPPGDLSVSRRIVSASYVVPEGANEVVLRAWDAAGQVLTASARFWAGDLTVVAHLTDFSGALLDGAEVVAALQADQEVRSVSQSRDGVVEFVNVPSSGVVLTARHFSGLEGEARMGPGERRARLVLR
jgi:hypothetical protein